MEKLRTIKDTLTPDDIVKYIESYEKDQVPLLDTLWQYYLGKNKAILDRKTQTSGNPDNRTPVSYGRKIITTFTGYAYRPGYITYKSENEKLIDELDIMYRETNEKIKTSLTGRNTGIFGLAYELLYIDDSIITGKPEVKLAVIDPREFIMLYDYSIEAKRKIGIRFYKVSNEDNQSGVDLYKVDVYYQTRTEHYDMTRDHGHYSSKLTETGTEPNYFIDLPIVPYYIGADMQGIIEPVKQLIDDYDVLVSDSMNEFDRFAHAYMRFVKMKLSEESKKRIKFLRIFEDLREKEDVTFLTKDIPTQYITFMSQLIRDQIHIQSHVPDLGGGSFADGISGVAVDRLMFDFENVCSNAEAEFDTGLYERMRLVLGFFGTTNRAEGTFDEITIVHKRNKPANTKEYAEIAQLMKNAGFSDYAIADFMPDEMIPDTQAELDRQEEQRNSAMADVESIPDPDLIPGAGNMVQNVDNKDASADKKGFE